MVQLVLHRRHPDRLRPRNRAPRAGPVDPPTHSMPTHSAVRSLMATGSPTTAHTWSVGASMGWDTSTGDIARTLPTPTSRLSTHCLHRSRRGATRPPGGGRYSSHPNLPKNPLLMSAIAKGVRPPWWIGEWERTARSWPTDSPGARLPRCSPPAGCARRRSARSSCPATTAPSGVPSTRARLHPAALRHLHPAAAPDPAHHAPQGDHRQRKRPPGKPARQTAA